MKCKQCGTEFQGAFCNGCGARASFETPPPIQPQQTQQIYQQPFQSQAPIPKKKKPFFLRAWFIVLVIIIIGVVIISGRNSGEKIVWDDIILGDILPEPAETHGEIHENSADELWIDIKALSDKQFNDYIEACKEKGFTVDAEHTSSSYDAYNKAGYKLSLSHYGSNAKMSIELESPMEMATITWPTSTAGKQLPAPKSTIGKFSYDNDDEFLVYVGNTSKTDFTEYINTCSNKGFNVDYSKGDNHYYAYNKNRWYVVIRYEGNNIMSIKISMMDDDSTDDGTEDPQTSTPDTTEKDSDKNDSESDEISSDFKSAMDSYEKFIDEYIAFMKKYKNNPSDLDLLEDYAEYLTKYTEFVEDFEKWEDEDLNDAELKYYLDVQTRVSQKMIDVL